MTGVYESTKPPTLVNDPDCLRVEAGALGFDESVDPVLSKQLIQAPVERVTGRRRWVRGRDPYRRLPITFTSAHRHRLKRRR